MYTLFSLGIPSTPTQGAWLAKNLPVGSRVGVDPRLMSKDQWTPLSKTLVSSGHSLIPIQPNLIDIIWDEKPLPPRNSIEPLGIEFTGKVNMSTKEKMLYYKFSSGKSWQDKVLDVIKEMGEKNASMLLLTALDDIACNWFLLFKSRPYYSQMWN